MIADKLGWSLDVFDPKDLDLLLAAAPGSAISINAIPAGFCSLGPSPASRPVAALQ